MIQDCLRLYALGPHTRHHRDILTARVQVARLSPSPTPNAPNARARTHSSKKGEEMEGKRQRC